MDREYLIKKWLDNELNAKELDAFKQLEDYNDLNKLSEGVKLFKVSDYDNHKELDAVLLKIKSKKSVLNYWWKPILKVAAMVVLFFSAYYFTIGFNTTVKTDFAQKTSIELPDNSQVEINAQSHLSFNKMQWNSKRYVKLHGEAYFKVAKGSKFNVITDIGIVTVFGTQFNVKQRKDFFEVICFEGSVGVTYKNQLVTLKPGYSFLVIDGKLYAKDLDTRKAPNWINNESYFKSLPYKEVLSELERQYKVTIQTNDLNINQLFTGSFPHDNLNLAIKSIALPLNLKYKIIDDKTIVLSRE